MERMEKKKGFEIKNTVGMFNLPRGILMLSVILTHSLGDYCAYPDVKDIPMWSLEQLIYVVDGLFTYGCMPAFFIMSGYGFRKKTMKKTIQSQWKFFWKPYCTVAVIVGLAAVVKKIIQKESVLLGLRYGILPFVFGSSPRGVYFGLEVGDIGPIWFFLVLVLSTVLLNAVMQEKQFWIQCVYIVILSIIGTRLDPLHIPFLLTRVMCGCGFVFAGWVMKKNKFFQMELPKTFLAICAAFVLGMALFSGEPLYSLFWAFDVSRLIIAYMVGIFEVYVLMMLNRFEDPISDAIRWIGRNSLDICCVHTIVYLVIPLEKVTEKLHLNNVLGFFFAFSVNLVLSIGVCFVLEQIKTKRAMAVQ